MRCWWCRQSKQDNYAETLVSNLVEELKSLSASNFLSFECVFKGGDCNKSAHELVMLGLCCAEGEEQYTSSTPDSM